MPDAPDSELRQRLKSAIWYTVGKIVDEECVQLGSNATPQYIAALTELVYTQAVTLATDIEAFARHASRKVVSTDDILMMCRRNDGLKEVLSEFVEDLESQKKEQKNSGKGLR
ncbi:kinetochore component CENP-S-domain-containing protein [Lipomyces kononenkoae]|uniref:Kinetochore component CENP-S-domain-containing protein n=1 Tax=Lipomyces kononenkoae TaxID=34357 RepID=A0ACC3SZ27_LIPKO